MKRSLEAVVATLLLETYPAEQDTALDVNLRGGCEKPNARIVGQIPARSVGRAEELGPPVVYLASAALGDTFTLHQNSARRRWSSRQARAKHQQVYKVP